MVVAMPPTGIGNGGVPRPRPATARSGPLRQPDLAPCANADGAAPGSDLAFWLNSAQAVIEDGRLVIVSNTGSQLGPIAFGAGTVIFAIGSQKIVPDLDTAFQRIDEYTFRLEDARLRGLYGVGT
jgi:hypothetical protein